MSANSGGILLASAARTATAAVGPLGALAGAIFSLDITAVPGGDTVQLVLEWFDPASNTWVSLFADATQVATARRTVLVHPQAGSAAAGIDAVVNFTLPEKWRARVVHSGSGSFTYSLGMGGVDA